MIKKSIKIELPSGLEARPVALLVQVASQYESKIHVEVEECECQEYYGYDDSGTGSWRRDRSRGRRI